MNKMLKLVMTFVVFLLFGGTAWSYTNPILVSCEEIVFGDEVLDGYGDPIYDHWDRQCLNRKTVFQKGEKISLLAKGQDFGDDYRWKIGFYQEDKPARDPIEFDWIIVMGDPHDYGTLPFEVDDLFVGEYTIKVWTQSVDNTRPYVFFDEIAIKVEGEPYYNPVTYVAAGWEYGSDDRNAPNRWDLQPVGVSDYFRPGSTVCVLSKAEDISQDHQWTFDISISGKNWFTTTPVWHDVGVGWTYTSDPPCFRVEKEGVYRTRSRLTVAVGPDYYKESTFTVGNNPPPAPPVVPEKIPVVIAPWLYLLLN